MTKANLLAAIKRGEDPRPPPFYGAEIHENTGVAGSCSCMITVMDGDFTIQYVWLDTPESMHLYYRGVGPRGVRFTCKTADDATRLALAIIEAPKEPDA